MRPTRFGWSIDTRRALGSLVAAASLLVASPARAEGWNVGGSAGATYAFGQTYLSFGLRAGYLVGLGFEPNVRADWWTAASPSVFKISPGLNWYAPLPFRPFVGGFYSHWFVSSNLPDRDSLGARAGVTFMGAGPASLSVGAAYEHALSCSVECDSWSPELTLGVYF